MTGEYWTAYNDRRVLGLQDVEQALKLLVLLDELHRLRDAIHRLHVTIANGHVRLQSINTNQKQDENQK